MLNKHKVRVGEKKKKKTIYKQRDYAYVISETIHNYKLYQKGKF